MWGIRYIHRNPTLERLLHRHGFHVVSHATTDVHDIPAPIFPPKNHAHECNEWCDRRNTYTIADGAADHILTVSLSRFAGNEAHGESVGVASILLSLDCVEGENVEVLEVGVV